MRSVFPKERCFTRCKARFRRKDVSQDAKQGSFGKVFHKVLRKEKNVNNWAEVREDERVEMKRKNDLWGNE